MNERKNESLHNFGRTSWRGKLKGGSPPISHSRTTTLTPLEHSTCTDLLCWSLYSQHHIGARERHLGQNQSSHTARPPTPATLLVVSEIYSSSSLHLSKGHGNSLAPRRSRNYKYKSTIANETSAVSQWTASPLEPQYQQQPGRPTRRH